MAEDVLGVVVKDPEDIRDTGIDWNKKGFLTTRETTISASNWDVPEGLVADGDSKTDTTTVVRLSGGTVGERYTITNHVTLANGEEFDRSIRIDVKER